MLKFESQSIAAKFIDPSGQMVEKPIEIRTHPITGRTSRIAFSRINEKEAGTDSLPQPPPDADQTTKCPFCQPRVTSETPQLHPDLVPAISVPRAHGNGWPPLPRKVFLKSGYEATIPATKSCSAIWPPLSHRNKRLSGHDLFFHAENIKRL